MAYDLTYYSDVFATIDSIYRQELNRPCDVAGAVNWFYHVRERGMTGEWVRERIRESDEWHAIHDRPPEPPVVTLPRLVPHGGVFRLETGARFTVIEASSFNLLGRLVLEGDRAITPVIDELGEIGFNFARVWTAYAGGPTFEAEIGRLLPAEHPELYDAMPELARICSRREIYIEYTGYTGPDDGQGGVTPDHWLRMGEALQPVKDQVLGELVNEHNAHPSLRDINAYRPIPGVLCAHGSNGAQSIPVRPPWQYETAHWNDTNEWWRKVGHNAWEFTEGADQLPASHVPTLSNETTRPDHDGTLHHFYDAAAGAALLCAGSCFHSMSGKKSALFSDADRPFAEAWVAGAKSVNLDFQEGRYVHAMELEGPTDLRVYQKILPDGRRETVRIRK